MRHIQVTIYSKTDCHLCDEAKAVLHDFAVRYPLQIEEIDIESDKEVYEKFKHEIPVILVEGRKLFKYRIDKTKLHRAIRDAMTQWTP